MKCGMRVQLAAGGRSRKLEEVALIESVGGLTGGIGKGG